jgi:predicted ATP-dependent serine protease
VCPRGTHAKRRGSCCEQFRAARAGQPRLVLLQGPAGVGKTSLLSRFAAELDDDARVLAVSGDESEPALPFPVTIGYSQRIGANHAPRTASYSATVTFTVSTTTP